MRTIILAIKPKYANMILNGEKTIEFRRKFPKAPLEKVLIYASAPISKIIGEFIPHSGLTLNYKLTAEGDGMGLDMYWCRFKHEKYGDSKIVMKPTEEAVAQVDKNINNSLSDSNFYMKYLKESIEQQMEGIFIHNPIRYDTPKTLSDYGIKTAPQNYIYLKGE